MVTMPTVRRPISLATRAISGAAPVPVPPPIPAVMKTIFVPSSSIVRISSSLSSAARSARAGLLPAPSPSVTVRPRAILTGTSERDSAWLSVLQSTKETSCMPSLNICVTALPPPPPTPTTLMIFRVSLGKLNCRGVVSLLIAVCAWCGGMIVDVILRRRARGRCVRNYRRFRRVSACVGSDVALLLGHVPARCVRVPARAP